MRVLDATAGGLIVVGCALSLPVFWWLLATPLVQLLKRRTRKPAGRRVI